MDKKQNTTQPAGHQSKDTLPTNHEKTAQEKRDHLDDDRKAGDYRRASDENDLKENHLAEDEE